MTDLEILSIHRRVAIQVIAALEPLALELARERGMTIDDATDFIYERLRHIVSKDDDNHAPANIGRGLSM